MADRDISSPTYVVSEAEWENFQTFVETCYNALFPGRTWVRLESAKRHYLAATFVPEDSFQTWHPPYVGGNLPFDWRIDRKFSSYDPIQTYETVLFHYIAALEALIARDKKRRNKKARALQIKERIARLTGSSEEDYARILDILNDAYKMRNSLIHGADFEVDALPFDVRKLRRVCQRALCVTLGLFAEGLSDKQVETLLLSLDGDGASSPVVETARTRVYGLIQDSTPFGEGTGWSVK